MKVGIYVDIDSRYVGTYNVWQLKNYCELIILLIMKFPDNIKRVIYSIELVWSPYNLSISLGDVTKCILIIYKTGPLNWVELNN